MIIPKLEPVESNLQDTASIKKIFLMGVQSSCQITKNLHALDSRDCFVRVEVDVFVKHKFSVENES